MTILDQETITWYSADAPPDDDQMVLVFAPGADEPVWLGYYDDGAWYEVGTGYDPGAKIDAKVTGWAPLPRGVGASEAETEGKS